MIDKINIFGELITVDCKEILMPYFDANPNRASSQGFSSLCMWPGHHYKIIDNYLCIVGKDWFGQETQGPYMFPPLPIDGIYDVDKLKGLILNIRDQIRDDNEIINIFAVPEVNISIFNQAVEGMASAVEDENNWDYLYNRNDLENLKGRKYAKKRNHLNYFLNNQTYTYQAITPNDIGELIITVDEFLKRKAEQDETDLLVQEECQMIKRILPTYEKFGLFGGLIRIDAKIRAFTMASKHTADTVDVAIEKADPFYRGLYQAINKDFVKSLPSEILYINREEDMGLKTLHQTKRSYHPCCMFKVYSYRI